MRKTLEHPLHAAQRNVPLTEDISFWPLKAAFMLKRLIKLLGRISYTRDQDHVAPRKLTESSRHGGLATRGKQIRSLFLLRSDPQIHTNIT